MTHCEICGKQAEDAKHPCRFEKACACWYGVPCVNGESYRTRKKVAAQTQITFPERVGDGTWQ